MARRPPATALHALGFGAAYGVSVALGRATRVDGSDISLLWPAAAVAVVWGLHATKVGGRAGTLHWGALAVVNFATTLATGASLGLALWFVVVNVVLAVVTVRMLRSGGARVALRDPADLGRLVFAVAVGSGVAAILATAYFAVTDYDSLATSTEILAHFAIRNGVTILAGVALVLRAREIRWPVPRPSPARLTEGILSSAAVSVVFVVVFWINDGLPLAFITLGPAMLISLRYSTTASTIFLNIAGVMIVCATLLNRGVFMDLSPGEQASLAQAMVGSLALIALTLSLFRDSRNELIDEMGDLARHDPLTRLANRNLLIERLDDALERATLHAPVGLVFVDLDGFKYVNDAWGHQEGDLLLVEIAARLRATVEPTDTVARMGGDEFVVVRPAVAADADLDELVRRIRSAVESPYGQSADAPFDRISASIGTAISDRSSTARSLLHQADQAMYDAKRAQARAQSPHHQLSDQSPDQSLSTRTTVATASGATPGL